MELSIPSCIQRGSKAAKEEAPEAYMKYVEEADDAANIVKIRMRLGITLWYLL